MAKILRLRSGTRILAMWHSAIGCIHEKGEKTMKIRRISANFRHDHNRGLLTQALVALFWPYDGSITEDTIANTLAEAMIRWVNAGKARQKEMANEIIALAWSADVLEISAVGLGVREISLHIHMQTSATRICLQRYVGGYYIELDFFEPNIVNAMGILTTAERIGAKFDVYDSNGLVERDAVLKYLLHNAMKYLKMIEGIEPNEIPEEYATKIMDHARETVALFEKALRENHNV